MAFEKLLGVEVPRRARWLRTLFAELQRIASHLLWLGTFTLDLGGALGGGSTLFLHCFRERELILDLFEEVTGARFHYNTHTIGGNRHDLPAGWAAQGEGGARDRSSRASPSTRRMSLGNGIFVDAHARASACSTASSRSSSASPGRSCAPRGVDHDLRRDAPYHAYDELEVHVLVEQGGDCLARAMVRFARDAREHPHRARRDRRHARGADLRLQADPPADAGRRPPAGRSTSASRRRAASSAPSSSAGGDTPTCPYRLKIRPPSLHALSALPYILPGRDGQRRGRDPRLARPDHGRGGPMNAAACHGALYGAVIVTVAPHDHRARHLVRAQVRRAHAVAPRPDDGRPDRPAPAARRRRQAPPEGGHRPARRRSRALRPRAARSPRSLALGVAAVVPFSPKVDRGGPRRRRHLRARASAG